MRRGEVPTTAASAAIVFDIQKFAVHDGPGIRTLVFLKGCPLHCGWCSNPESQTLEAQMFYFSNRCLGCLACVDECSKGAITIDDEGRPLTDRQRCDDCGECIEICYADARVVIGRSMTVDEVMAEIRQDIPFYRRSGGGVTLGGGEVLVWSEFAEKLLSLCKAEFIDTAVEACGYADWPELERLVPYVDRFYYDLKHIDSETHAQLTGVGNEVILANLERLARTSASIVVRIPVVPGLNDDAENVRAIARHVRSNRLADKIELLPYHRLGEDKYARLGRIYELAGVQPPSDEKMRTLAAIVAEEGMPCQLGG